MHLSVGKHLLQKLTESEVENRIIEIVRQLNKGKALIKNDNEYVDIQFYKSGKKQSIIPVKNNQCHGKCFDWYENGKIKWLRENVSGNQVGKSINYNSDGILEKISKHKISRR